MKEIRNKSFDEERALYGISDTRVSECTFAGPADGESALKECREVTVENCSFSLRYPLWHAKDYTLSHSVMDELTRAPIWYSSNGRVEQCTINGIKTLRECENTEISDCVIRSDEFGWRCKNISISNSSFEGVYFLFESRDVKADKLAMTGKYSFQYMENVHIRNSVLDTKDAFWHAKNVTVENSVVKGEYLGWFSEGLTLINCHIEGTQPLCYCKALRLIDCTMENTDLSFEYSDVEATVKGHILSVKNPRSGHITADSIGEIVTEGSVMETHCEITTKGERP